MRKYGLWGGGRELSEPADVADVRKAQLNAGNPSEKVGRFTCLLCKRSSFIG